MMLIVHHMQLMGSHKKYANYRHKGVNNRDIAAATIDKRGVHLQFDLILRVDHRKARKKKLKQYVTVKSDFWRFLQSIPCCGGELQGNVPFSPSAEIDFYKDKSELHTALLKMPSSSFIIEDATDTLQAAMLDNVDKDVMTHLMDFISRPHSKKASPSQKKLTESIEAGVNTETSMNSVEDETIIGMNEKSSGYKRRYIPLAVGYRSLDSIPVKRQGARISDNGDNLHIFAEPLIGLGLIRSVASFRLKHHFSECPVWWHYKVDPDQALYLTRGVSYQQINL
jgi:hypothetical protein